MTADIVGRLRDQGKDAFAKHYSLGMFKLCTEAADEIERLRGVVQEPRDETGWLIEVMGENGTPTYHQLEHDDDWTFDANKAVRFSRREDAQAYIDHIGWTVPKPVEHMWCRTYPLSSQDKP